MGVIYFIWYKHIGEEVTGAALFTIPLIPVAIFAGSIIVHEVAHAMVMGLNGIKVAKISVEMWGGYTQPAGDDPLSLLRLPAAKYFSVAVAGPAANLLVAIGIGICCSRLEIRACPNSQVSENPPPMYGSHQL